MKWGLENHVHCRMLFGEKAREIFDCCPDLFFIIIIIISSIAMVGENIITHPTWHAAHKLSVMTSAVLCFVL